MTGCPAEGPQVYVKMLVVRELAVHVPELSARTLLKRIYPAPLKMEVHVKMLVVRELAVHVPELSARTLLKRIYPATLFWEVHVKIAAVKPLTVTAMETSARTLLKRACPAEVSVIAGPTGARLVIVSTVPLTVP